MHMNDVLKNPRKNIAYSMGIRQRGFTLMEIAVVLGIIAVLASILFPVIMKAKKKALLAQCSSNLRQLSQALTMYSIDHNRDVESYPDYLTDLYTLGYVRNINLFVCPADTTRASPTASPPTLKPIFQAGDSSTTPPGVPIDNKATWAERTSITPLGRSTGFAANSSYLYEFSTRPCEAYDPTGINQNCDNGNGNCPGLSTSVFSPPYDWFVSNGTLEPDGTFNSNPSPAGWLGYSPPYSPSTFAYNLVQLSPGSSFGDGMNWDYDPTDNTTLCTPPDPQAMDRYGQPRFGGTYYVSWQDAKFWQLQYGDVYTTGVDQAGVDLDQWGNIIIPTSWGTDPWDQIWPGGGGTADPQQGYPRTWMPIIRCFWHVTPQYVDDQSYIEVLNMALDGNTYMSAAGWEETAWQFGRQAAAGP